MEGSYSPKMGSKVSEFKPDTRASKRRKVVEKRVVKVRMAANAGSLKSEGPPSDFWSWRKYGQKPIKGSPYPRGYYRCSTSKGCTAKKQVERSRTDASFLIITYTSCHNHPGPDLPNSNLNQQPKEHHLTQTQPQPQPQPTEDLHPNTPPQQELPQEEEAKQDQPIKFLTDNQEPAREEQNSINFHYLPSPLRSSEDIMISQEDPFTETPEKSHETTSILLDLEPISCTELTTLSSTHKSEENDFFDELEELNIPTSSAGTSFTRGNFFDERIPVVRS